VRADVAAFHGRVRGFDEGVGIVLDALDARGLADGTIVVVTTDHGIAFPRAKGTLYDAGSRSACWCAGRA
jgi:N-sulfoglucosamine sulfohydrolase